LLLWRNVVETVLLHSWELLLAILLHLGRLTHVTRGSHVVARGWGTHVILGRLTHVVRRWSHIVARGWRPIVVLGGIAHVWVVHAIWLLRKVVSVVYVCIIVVLVHFI